LTSEAAGRVAWREVWAGGYLPYVVVLSLGIWLHAADATLVATLMPPAVAEIGGIELVAWAFALYLLGSIVAGAVAGLASRRIGLRHAVVAAALVYAVGCAISAAAPTMPVLLAGRLLQGLGGGGLLALSFVGVERLFPARLMPRLLGVISAVWGVSSFMGPLVGGLFAEAGLWRGGFWAFAGQAAALAAVVALILPAGGAGSRSEGAPWRRLAIYSVGVLAIATAGVEVSLWLSPPLIVAGLALLAWFFVADRRAGAARLFPHGVLDWRRAPGAGYVMMGGFSMATIAFTVYGPLLLKLMHGAGPLTVGYLIAIESIAWSALAVIISGRRDGDRMIRLGGAMVTLGVVGFAVTVPFAPIWACVPALLLAGGGFGIAYTFILARISASVADDDKERAAAALPTMQLIGYTVGAAGLGIVANAAGIERATPAAAANAALWLFAAGVPVAAFSLIATWRLAR
jgi:MFS family permease